MESTRVSVPLSLMPSPRESQRSRPMSRLMSWRGDAAALAVLLAIITATVGFRFIYDTWLSQFDILNFFLPNFGYVGSRIRAFQVPAWNPYFSSGTPMAGDAGGGWMYLPVMVSFALFSTATAMKVMVLLQTLVGGLATYLFGRRLGLLPLAALFAATALAVGPALYDATGQSTVIGQISAWLPLGMAGAECAIQAGRSSARLAWSGVTAVALVQMFAAWPQGFMYGALLIGAWFVYRGAIDVPAGACRGVAHIRRTLIAGTASALFAASIGAAAILPRLEFNAQSTIAGGDYATLPGSSYAAMTYSWVRLLSLYLEASLFWRIIEFNSVIILLAVLALIVTPKRYGAPFFAVSILVCIDLAATPSLTRGVFYLLPVFKTIHSHRPTATMYMVYLPLAMLAGAGVQAVLRLSPSNRDWRRLAAPLPVLLLAMAIVKLTGPRVSYAQAGLAIAATFLIIAAGTVVLRWQPARRGQALPAIVLALLLLSLAYPSGLDFARVVRNPSNYKNNLLAANPSIDRTVQTVLAHTDPGSAADLLQYFQATQPPFRYAAYFGSGSPGNHNAPSSALSRDPGVVAILANGRSVQLGLEQVSGYNPMHLKVYADYVTAMNGVEQNYHWLDVYQKALNSQLFDMLNVRYVLVPANLRHAPPIADYGQVIYRDDLVVVYENPRAFPRAWIVHEVLPDHGDTGLTRLANGDADGRVVAFVSGVNVPIVPAPAAPPARPLSWSAPARDRVEVTALRPERIVMRTVSSTNGYLVVSEPWTDGWRATIDGKPVQVLPTDHALQGLFLPAGDHQVVITYAPASLAVGLPLTGGGAVALLGTWIWAIDDRRRRGH